MAALRAADRLHPGRKGDPVVADRIYDPLHLFFRLCVTASVDQFFFLRLGYKEEHMKKEDFFDSLSLDF